MKYSNLKAVFSMGLLVLVMMVLTAFRTVPPEVRAAAVAYEPGMLVKGRDHFIYYITQAGTRRPIYDRARSWPLGLKRMPLSKRTRNCWPRFRKDRC